MTKLFIGATNESGLFATLEDHKKRIAALEKQGDELRAEMKWLKEFMRTETEPCE